MTSVGLQFSIAGFPGDILVLAFLAAALLFFGLFAGSRFSAAFLISLYIARTIVEVTPSFRRFLLESGLVLPSQTNAIIFVLGAIGITWLLSGSALSGFFKMTSGGIKQWWQIAAASILGSGLFAVLFFPLLPKGALATSKFLDLWLLSDPMPFIWVLAPILLLVVIRTDK